MDSNNQKTDQIPLSWKWSTVAIPSPKIGELEMGFCSRVVVSHNLNSPPQEAHVDHFSTFTTHRRQFIQNISPSNEPGHTCHAIHDRAGHHVGTITLEWSRRQLSHDPTFLLHDHSLGAGFLAVLLSELVSERGYLPAGWR